MYHDTQLLVYFSVSPGENSEDGRRTAKKEKGLVIIKKEKKEKKSKEKETRYAHLGEDSSGNDEPDGKYVYISLYVSWLAATIKF